MAQIGNPRRQTGGAENGYEDSHINTTPWYNGQGQIPPHDELTEKTILAEILVEADPGMTGVETTQSLAKIREALVPSDFYSQLHNQIMTVVYRHFDEGLPISVEDIASTCKRDCDLEVRYYLEEIKFGEPVAGGEGALKHRIQVVKELSRCRALLAPVSTALDLLWKGHLRKADPVIASLQTTRLNGTPTHPARAMESALLTGEQILESFKKVLQSSHIIDGIWPETCLLMGIAAPKDHFKSFVILDMLLAMACGIPYHGRKVRRQRVLYIAAEGETGTPARIVAWCKRHGVEKIPDTLTILPMACKLDDPEYATWLRKILLAAKEAGRPYDLVVVDTVARSMDGDENSTKDMGAFVQAMADITRAVGPKFGYVHHFGKDPSKGLRGASSLVGATDLVIILKKPVGANSDRLVIMECQHIKDAEKFKPMLFDLVTVDTGYCTIDGWPATSLVPVLSDQKAPKDVKKITGATLAAFKGLMRAVKTDHALPVPPDIIETIPVQHRPMPQVMVDEDLWRKLAYEEGVSGADTPDAKRVAFNRARANLLSETRVIQREQNGIMFAMQVPF